MAMALMIIGTAVSVMGAFQQAQQIEDNGAAQVQAQSEIAEYNAAVKDIEAQQQLEGAKMEEMRLARTARLFKSQQEARIGASGTSFGGSSLEVLGDIAYQTSVDRSLVLRAGTIAGATTSAEAKADRAEARWQKLYGTRTYKQKASAARMGGISAGNSGESSIYGAMPMGRA